MARPRIVDPHMHLWDLGRHYYGWLQDEPLPNNPAGDMTPIAYRSYGLADYFRDTAGWDVAGMVHVECGLSRDAQLSETDWLQGLANDGGYPQGIVAGAELNDPDVERLLAAHAERPNVRGIRQIVNWHADPQKTYNDRDLLRDEQWRRGFGLLAKYGLRFDLQIYPGQMADAARLAGEHPGVPVVLNHTGMPADRDEAGQQGWRDGMALLAERPNVSVKISGLAMVDRAWTTESIRPFVMHAIETFGVDRCMFASNFPVESVHGAFGAHYGAYDEITRDFTADERARLFAGTAEAIYAL